MKFCKCFEIKIFLIVVLNGLCPKIDGKTNIFEFINFDQKVHYHECDDFVMQF